MRIDFTTEEKTVSTYDKIFPLIRNHYLRIKNISIDFITVRITFKNRHRLIIVEFKKNERILDKFSKTFNINCEQNNFEILKGQYVKLEIEKKNDAIDIISINQIKNSFLEESTDAYFRLLNFSVQNYTLFLQALMNNEKVNSQTLSVIISSLTGLQSDFSPLTSIELLNGLIDNSLFQSLQKSTSTTVPTNRNETDIQSFDDDDLIDDPIEYNEKHSLYAYDPDTELVFLNERTMDDICEDFIRNEEKQVLEDLYYQEKYEEEAMLANPLNDNTIWSQIYGNVFNDSFLYDVLINYEFSCVDLLP